ncbi:MAG: diguanylate cyclase [Christensenella sp.]
MKSGKNANIVCTLIIIAVVIATILTVTFLWQSNPTNQVMFTLVFILIIVCALLFVSMILRAKRKNKELLDANQNYQSLIEHINGGMLVAVHAETADETIITYASPGFTDMTGYTLSDIQNIYNGRYLDIICDEDRDAVFAKYLEQLSTGNSYHMPYRIHKKDGSVIWVMDNGYLVDDFDGLRNHSIITDITVIKEQEEELRLSENRFSVAINASSGALFEVDLKKQLYTHFENAERIFGESSEKLLADTRAFASLPFDEFADAVTNYFFHPDDRALAKAEMEELTKKGTISYEARLRRADNSYIWAQIDLNISMDAEGAPLRLIGYMSDINDVKRRSEFLESKVQTDPMTDLYNKVATATLADEVVRNNHNGLHALIILDIDDFKNINDTLGHAFGDVVLIEIAAKLKTLFRGSDIVGRVGGDEFAILMKDVPDISRVLKKATELSAAFRQTFTGEKGDYKISCSMGIIMISNNNDSFDVLYRKADAALYQAKQTGKDQFVLYREEEAHNYPIESARTNDEELQNLNVHHNTEEYIFELLYASDDFDAGINRAIAAIGRQYNVSRVTIFENNENNGTLSNIYEWCNDDVMPKKDELQNVEASLGLDCILDSFDHDGLLYCNDVRELPTYFREILEAKGALSTLQMTIANEEKIYGIIGFDDCSEYRVWTAEEIEKLSFLAKMLGVFLFKRKMEVAVLENLETRLKILDVLPDYMCVVNPKTHTIEYANNKMKELVPIAQSGAFCFSTLRNGQEGPCKTCLVERIKSGDTDNIEIVSEDGSVHLKVNVLLIDWTTDQKMVLLYGTEKAAE